MMNDEEYELFELAMSTRAKGKRKKILEDLLEKNDKLFDVEIEYIRLAAKDSYDILRMVDDALYRAERELEGMGIELHENMGSFYGILETRPYMRLLYMKLEALIDVRYIMEGLAIAENMLVLNESDNLGVRYNLVNIFSLIMSGDDLELTLDERWEGFESIEFNLALGHAHYNAADFEAAENQIQTLLGIYPEFEKGIKLYKSGKYNFGSYQYESAEHVANALGQLEPLMNPAFRVWLMDSVEELKQFTSGLN